MPAPDPSNLDADQCIRGAYEDASGRLRVDAQITGPLDVHITAPLDVDGEVLVDIRAADGDSVLIVGTEDATTTGTQHVVKVHPDGSIDTNVTGLVITDPNVNIHDSSGNNLTSTSNSLNVNITNTVPVSQSGVWTFGRTWTLSSGTDSVTAFQGGTWNINNISGTISLPTGAATAANQATQIASLASIDSKLTSPIAVSQSGSWTVTANQGTSPWVISGTVAATQSGTWTTGRTWTLNNSTDSVNVGNFPATQAVTQSTSPWVVSGTVTSNQGTSPWVVSGTVAATQSGTWNINNISGTISLPTGASTSANQTTANTSLSSIDGKLNSLGQKNMAGSVPVVISSDQSAISVTDTQKSTALIRYGEIAVASTTSVNIYKTNLSNVITTDTALVINSTSANDTAAGTGARTVQVTYYLQNGSGPFTTTATMNGTSVVFLPSMSFIERLQVLTVGSNGSNVGTITISLLAPLTNIADIAPGDNETYYCHHFVPLGKTSYLTSFRFSHTGDTAATGAVFNLQQQVLPFTGNNAKIAVIGKTHLSGTDGTQEVIFPSPIIITGPAYISCILTPDNTAANTFHGAITFYDL